MDAEFKRLRGLEFFGDLPSDRLESAALLWETRILEENETLWWQGEPSVEIAFVTRGSLSVHIAEEEIAILGVGDLLGEASVFTKEDRTASITALERTELLLLSTSHLETLRSSHPDMYDRVLNSSLNKMAQRVQQMGKEIAKLALGDSARPMRKEESALKKFWKKLTGSGNKTPPNLTSILRKLPKLRSASKEVLQQIIDASTPHFVEMTNPIFLEGEQGDSVFILAEGCIDVKRNIMGGKSEKLATLYPGALFGTGSLLLSERRNAACVASDQTDVWIFEFNRKAHNQLTGESGRLWRESLIAALSFQLRNADDRLVALKLGGSPTISDFDKIRGALEGYQG